MRCSGGGFSTTPFAGRSEDTTVSDHVVTQPAFTVEENIFLFLQEWNLCFYVWSIKFEGKSRRWSIDGSQIECHLSYFQIYHTSSVRHRLWKNKQTWNRISQVVSSIQSVCFFIFYMRNITFHKYIRIYVLFFQKNPQTYIQYNWEKDGTPECSTSRKESSFERFECWIMSFVCFYLIINNQH